MRHLVSLETHIFTRIASFSDIWLQLTSLPAINNGAFLMKFRAAYGKIFWQKFSYCDATFYCGNSSWTQTSTVNNWILKSPSQNYSALSQSFGPHEISLGCSGNRNGSFFHTLRSLSDQLSSYIRAANLNDAIAYRFFVSACDYDWQCPAGNRCENGTCVPRP